MLCLYYDLAITYNFSKELIARFEGTISHETNNVLKTSSFNKCGKIALQNVLELDALECSETVIFGAVVSWAMEACANKSLPPTPDNLRAELGNCVSLIRFPVMTSLEYCSCLELYPGLLDRNVEYDIWHYILAKRALTSAKHFNQSLREIKDVNVSFSNQNITFGYRPQLNKSVLTFDVNHEMCLSFCHFVIPTENEIDENVDVTCNITLNGESILHEVELTEIDDDNLQDADRFKGSKIFLLEIDKPMMFETEKHYELCFQLNIFLNVHVQLFNANLSVINGIKFNYNDNCFVELLNFKTRKYLTDLAFARFFAKE